VTTSRARRFRRRLRRHATEIENDEAYPFLIFRDGDDALPRRLDLRADQTWRRPSRDARLLDGRAFRRSWLHGAGGPRRDRLRFATLRLHRIEAACLPHNDRSIQLLTRTNFQPEGMARAYLRINGLWQDHLLFALLESDPVSLRLPRRDR